VSVAYSHGSVADYKFPFASHFTYSLSQSARLLSDGHAPKYSTATATQQFLFTETAFRRSQLLRFPSGIG
jgi:hypothetical protein